MGLIRQALNSLNINSISLSLLGECGIFSEWYKSVEG